MYSIPGFLSAWIVSAESENSENMALTPVETWLQMADDGSDFERWNMLTGCSGKRYDRGVASINQGVLEIIRECNLNNTRVAEVFHFNAGVLDGEYKVIQFRCSFQNKRSAVEMVTPIQAEMVPDGFRAITSNNIILPRTSMSFQNS